MRILVDHTAFHTFKPGPHQTNTISALYGLLQVFEELLLADEVWLSNTPGTRALPRTVDVLQDLEAAGLGNTGNTGLVRVADVSASALESVAVSAGASLADFLVLGGSIQESMRALREKGAIDAGPTTPSGVLPIDFVEFRKLVGTYENSRREDLLQSSLNDEQLNSTFAPFLSSPALFEWLTCCTRAAPDSADPLYKHLLTLARQAINVSLAERVAEQEPAADPHVFYAPAYARARALRANYAERKRLPISEPGARVYAEATERRGFGASVSDESSRLPVFGAWFMMSLPRTANATDYFKAVAEHRASPQFQAFRRWAAREPSEADFALAIANVRRKLGVPEQSASVVTEWVQLSLLGTKLNKGFTVAREIERLPDGGLLRMFFSRRTKPAETLLTGCLEMLLQERGLATQLLERASRLLAI